MMDHDGNNFTSYIVAFENGYFHSDGGMQWLYAVPIKIEKIESDCWCEVIHYVKKSWNGVNDVELATLKWVALRAQLSSCKAKSIINRFLTLLRFNKKRLHSTIGYVSPFELERRYYDNLTLSGIAA
jgi:hypothetical protein